MKPLSEIKDDIDLGDLVLLHLAGKGNHYVGFLWHNDPEEIERKFKPSRGRKRHHIYQARLTKGADLVFCSVSGEGVDQTRESQPTNFSLEYQMQFVGVNLKRETLGPAAIIGYQVLRSAQQTTETD